MCIRDSPGTARGGGPQSGPQPPPPHLRQEPAQALAGPVELRQRPRRPATNNHAERGLRGAVIYRKLSLGSQSDSERTIERLLSASVTCRLQRRSLFAYLADVCLLYTSPSPRDRTRSRMPSSA